MLWCSAVGMPCALMPSSITADARPQSRIVLWTKRSAARASRMDVAPARASAAAAGNQARTAGENKPGGEALGPHSTAHVLGPGAGGLDRHEQGGTTPKTALNLQVPMVAFPASFHRDPLTPKIPFNALQPWFG